MQSPKWLAASDILCFLLGFYPRDGEQIAGTEVPGYAEGRLKPAFKTNMPEQVAPASPSGVDFLMQTGHMVSPCPHNTTIHHVLYGIMGSKSVP